MQKNIVYLCKNKLAGIDGLLPVLLEAKMCYPDTKVIIAFRNEKHMNAVKKNYNIWEALKALDSQLYAIRGRNKFITLLRLARFILTLSRKDNIIFKDVDALPLHNFAMKLLRVVSKIKEVKVYLTVQSYELLKNVNILSSISRRRKGAVYEASFFKGRYDYFLTALDSDQFKFALNIDAPKDKMVKVGFTRKLPAWSKFSTEAVRRNKVINDGDYFLYILTNTYKRRSCLEEPEMIKLVEESLSVLKKYNNRCKTVFKPHVTTDIKRVEGALDKIGYKNYVIDYGHPFILSSKAKFILGNAYSCTMFDAYFQGVPVIEYCQYDPEFFAEIGRTSYGGRFCDFCIYRNKKQLEGAVEGILDDKITVKRNPNLMKEGFPDTRQEFYNFLYDILSREKLKNAVPY